MASSKTKGREVTTLISGVCYSAASLDISGQNVLLSCPDAAELHLLDPGRGSTTCIARLGPGHIAGAGQDPDGRQLYVADMGSAAVMQVVEAEEGKEGKGGDPEVKEFVTDYEGVEFAGPNSICFSSSGAMYFTDSGPLGESTLENPVGSCFCIAKSEDGKEQVLKPLALKCLAHPAGMAISANDKAIYIAETLNNRILRFVEVPAGVWQLHVYCQLSGRMGPRALACGPDGTLYVGRFESRECSSTGIITVLDPEGRFVEDIEVPGAEITGVALVGNSLIVTEQSTESVYSIAL